MSIWNVINRERLPKHRNWRTAIHEAGHAMLAIGEGADFEDIVLEQDGNRNGQIRNLSLPPDVDSRLRIYLAGIMAVRLLRHRWDTGLFNTAWDDLGSVSNFLRDDRHPDRTLRWNVTETERRLLENWDAVLNIARALLLTRFISFDEALRLFRLSDKGSSAIQPGGKMGSKGWQKLLDHIEMRMRFPNGLEDVAREYGFQISRDYGA
jgi:hypothetical protein